MSQQFLITAPDGTKYQVTGPDGATEQDALAQVQAQHAGPATPAAQPPQNSVGYQPRNITAGALFGDMGRGLAGGFLHGVGTLADVATGTSPGPQSHADRWAAPFTPQTSLGQLDPSQVQAHAAVTRGLDQTIGTGPLAQTVRERVPQAAEAIATVVPFLKGAGTAGEIGQSAVQGIAKRMAPLEAPEAVVGRMAQQSGQSMGAAAAAPSLTNVSPGLRQAISVTARKTGGAINPEAFSRHVEADTLPVPVRLTEGQATQNPRLISEEMNARGATAMTEHVNAQNGQLADNMRAIRDQAGPDVFTTNPVEHGETLIAAYRAKDAAAQAKINQLYDTLRNVLGGNFPVDAQALLTTASKELHKSLLYDSAPKAEMTTLTRLANSGQMTFENFESLRTNLARTMRSQSVDGNTKAAAGVIRDAMEELPLGPASSQIKPYADAARAAYREQAQALAADPAYKAAVTESVPPDRFVARFLLNAPREDVAAMRTNLAGNDPALQTMGVAALDHLRGAAKLDPQYRGNFASQSFNNALVKLDPKLRELVSPQVSETLEKLGNVARYTTSQPRGSFVNNSNTFVAGAATHAANIAEGVANKAAFGIPIGTWTRNAIAQGRQQNAFARATAPGAGLGRLQERH